MSELLDAARALARPPLWTWDGECGFCDGTDSGDNHAPDCPWLALPRIVAAIEAAEHFVSYNHYQDLLRQTVSYRALIEALRGGRTAAPGGGGQCDGST